MPGIYILLKVCIHKIYKETVATSIIGKIIKKKPVKLK